MNNISDFIKKLSEAKQVSREAVAYLKTRMKELLGLDDEPAVGGMSGSAANAYDKRIYTDEPIRKPDTKPAAKSEGPYERIRSMRKLVSDKANRGKSAAELFYIQAKFMEDYERFDLNRYSMKGASDRMAFGVLNWNYNQMSLTDLARYFAWRTEIRNGNFATAELMFYMLYSMELCHLIGVDSAEKGFEVLSAFLGKYSRRDERLNYFKDKWLDDFVIYYGLDSSLLGTQSIRGAEDLPVLLEPERYADEELFRALDSSSAYSLTKSLLYKKDPAALTAAAPAVFRAVLADPDSDRAATERKYVGSFSKLNYCPFSAVMFFDWMKRDYYRYDTNAGMRYICDRGAWFVERFTRSSSSRSALGAVMKAADCCLREKLRMSSRLKQPELDPKTLSIIKRTIDAIVPDKPEAACPTVEIDLTKLASIRRAAFETQELLLAPTEEKDDEMQSADPPIPNAGTADAPKAHDAPALSVMHSEKPATECSAPPDSGQAADPLLTPAERLLLECLLENRPYEEKLRALGVLPSIAADGANEKLLDILGDTALIENGGKYEILSDYFDDVKGFLLNDTE